MPDSSPSASSSAPERPSRDDKSPSWRVEPAPDGRGAPPAKRPPIMPRQRRGTFVAVLLALLAVNLILALVTSKPTERTRVPYQPFFVEQVKAGNVQEISSQEQTI